jgi:hypothetical protein
VTVRKEDDIAVHRADARDCAINPDTDLLRTFAPWAAVAPARHWRSR